MNDCIITYKAMWLVYNFPGIVVSLDIRRALKIDLCIHTSRGTHFIHQ